MRAESVGRKKVYWVFLISALLLFVVLVLYATPAQAQQSFSPTDAEELISAMEAANAEPGTPATITLIREGTYTLTGVHNTNGGPNGLPVVSSEVTIEGNGATIERQSGAPRFRILHVSGSGDLTLEGATVRGGDSGRFLGGGIFNERGTVTITDSTVSENTGRLGGGLSNLAGNMTVTDSDVTGNIATSIGGGVFSSTTSTNLDDPANRTTIVNSTLSGNIAPHGGGIANNNGRTELIHTTITGNEALQDDGQGIRSFGDISTRTVVSGSIVSANSGAGPDVALVVRTTDSFRSAGHNLIGTLGSEVNAFQDGVNGDQTGVTEPGLEPLSDNGGPTQTHALQQDSPAIDKGNPDDFPETDQRGVQRPQGADPDIGAFELVPATPALGLDPESVEFGEQQTGTASDPETVTITNDGTVGLTVDAVNLSGNDADQFSIDSQSCTATPIAPQDDCTVELTFSPDSMGEKDATLAVASDAPGSPHEVALSGTGVAAPPPPPDDPSDTSLALTSGRNIITFGGSVGLSGRLVDEDGKSLSGKQVTLERRYTNQQRFQRVGTRTTNNAGRFSASVNPPRNAVFRARFTGDEGNSASAAATSVRVRVVTRLNLSRESVPVGQNVVIAGNVRPAKTSFANLTIRRGGQVVLNRRVNLNTQSRYRFVYQVPARGNYLVQVRYAGDRQNLAGAASERFGVVAASHGSNQSSVQRSRTRIEIPQKNRTQSQQRTQFIRGR